MRKGGWQAGIYKGISSSPGASSDFDSATKIAKLMVTRFGMCEKVGQLERGLKREGCTAHASQSTVLLWFHISLSCLPVGCDDLHWHDNAESRDTSSCGAWSPAVIEGLCDPLLGQLNSSATQPALVKTFSDFLFSCRLQESYERAKALLKSHAKEHKNLADALLMYETLDAKEIQLVLEGKTLETRWN